MTHLETQTQPAAGQPVYHVLLIGIDAYPARPLKGCVQDIDSIQRLLVTRAGIPPSAITRLVSPHPTYVADATVEAREATLANIVAAFAELGSDAVGPTDRVFVYYSGHGTRLEVNDAAQAGFRGAGTRFREALVPVDGSLEGPAVLFDFELNALLANITTRTRSVTMILDCCHSSGATRSLDDTATSTRFIDLAGDTGGAAAVTITEERAQLLAAAVAGNATPKVGADLDACHVVAACLNDELAKEGPRDVAEGQTRSGLLTRSLLEALADIPDAELTTAPWARFWNRVRAQIETDPELPVQHSWMSGGLARAWLAGPPNDGDIGLGIVRTEGAANEYVIDAGTVAGITTGAQIAVYGPEPFTFPRLGTPEDIASRTTATLLEVTDATPSQATARATSEAFDLPAGARGRLVRPGVAERLRCAAVPEDPAVVAALRASELLEVTNEASALARLERLGDGTWVLTDDVHGVRPDDPVLARLGADEIVAEAPRVMEQYVRYAGPIRMAQRCGDLPNTLQISLLACPQDQMRDGKVLEAKFSDLPEMARASDGSYALRADTDYCVRVHNTSNEKLLVHLFNSDASGRVVLLGHQEIDGRTIDHFWADSETGLPFYATVPDGAHGCIDRFSVIGTTDASADLRHLVDDGEFRGGTRSVGTRRPANPPAELWTAAGVIVRTTASTDH